MFLMVEFTPFDVGSGAGIGGVGYHVGDWKPGPWPWGPQGRAPHQFRRSGTVELRA